MLEKTEVPTNQQFISDKIALALNDVYNGLKRSLARKSYK